MWSACKELGDGRKKIRRSSDSESQVGWARVVGIEQRGIYNLENKHTDYWVR